MEHTRKREVASMLAKSSHGNLSDYIPVAREVSAEDPNFYAHLCAWNHQRGSVRDAKVALPVLGWPAFPATEEYAGLRENSIACLADLSPRDLLRAWRFSREVRIGTGMLNKAVEYKLRKLESKPKKWERVAMQHRRSLKELYAVAHLAPDPVAHAVLFRGDLRRTPGLRALCALSSVSPTFAAGLVAKNKIPFLVAVGAAGPNAKHPDFVLAMIDSMTPTELVTNSKMLERLGLNSTPHLRAAYDQALERAAGSKKQVLKTSVAAAAVTEGKTKEKLEKLQAQQLDGAGLRGNWLVLCDKSGSMQQAIEFSKHVAATLAAYAEKVNLTFFDTQAYPHDVSGMSLQQIQKKVGPIVAVGGTSIGVGLARAMANSEEYDGIVILSDFMENTSPAFLPTYNEYQKRKGTDVPVYCLLFGWGDGAKNVPGWKDMEWRDMKGVDYHSIPNLVLTMRANRYSLVDEIMETSLLTLEEVN